MSNVLVGTCTRCGSLNGSEFNTHDTKICGIVYTIQDNVYGMKKEDTPLNPYVYGYGKKIPTKYWIKYESGRKYETSRWRRVYVMQYGNAGSAYILFRGKEMFLDSDTEYRLEKL